jgi:hypothetical protein
MRYRKEFFDLQIQFAQTVVALIDIPIEKALLDYTNIYVRFALGRAFDQHHPIWRCYTDGLRKEVDLSDWTYGAATADGHQALVGHNRPFDIVLRIVDNPQIERLAVLALRNR